MAIDQELAERVRQSLAGRPGLSEKKMFGGIVFLLKGKISCGVYGQELLVRLAPETTDEALRRPHTRLFDISARVMKGWVLVHPDGIASEAGLAEWVNIGVSFAAALPAK